MGLPSSYTIKTGAITAYFEALKNAEAPSRLSYKFLESLGFSSSNDRLLIGILKDLGFLNADGAPQDRYYEFLDQNNSRKVLADGVRESYSDLFAVNTKAHELDNNEVYNKLRVLYRGEKKDSIIKMISKTFVALCEYADFETSGKKSEKAPKSQTDNKETSVDSKKTKFLGNEEKTFPEFQNKSVDLKSLQYHINIVLPDTSNQATYDAIFKSLRDHLG